ncbi:MAG TPA: hypothetical protein VK558_09780 [Patescibacteria group bacterium]|nr:hypothetical protein [Patescibacteria group bacterium]
MTSHRKTPAQPDIDMVHGSDHSHRGLPPRLLILLFALFLLVPSMTQLAGLGSDGKAENRVLAPPPAWPTTLHRLRDFSGRAEAYVSDRFGLRSELVRMNSLMRYHLGLSSTPLVAIGNDGWLFYTADKLMEQHTGDDIFTDATLEQWITAMEADRDWLAKRGIPFYIVLAPEKSTIYPELLPAYQPRPGATNRVDQVVARLHRSTLEFIDPRAAIIAAKIQHPLLYPRGDTHWGQRAAFIAYSQLMDRVHLRFPTVPAVTLNDYDVGIGADNSDLVGLLGLQKDLHYTEEKLNWRGPSHILGTEIAPAVAKVWGWPVSYIHTDLTNQPRLLVFGDSFSDYILGPSFLYETFRDPVFTHHNGANFNFNLATETKPDLVVFEFAERYLRAPPGLPSTK